MSHRKLTLTAEQHRELANLRDHAPQAYVRERAAALLKVAGGASAAHVARQGILRPRQPETVYAWLNRYTVEGVAGLRVRAGRGRKAAYAPRPVEAAQTEIKTRLAQSPRTHQKRRTRWRLRDLGEVIPWLQGVSAAGIYRILRRLGFSRKQARKFIRSPDTAFDAKWRAILRAFAEAVANPAQVVLLFLDEITYYRQPAPAPAYHPQGHLQPCALQRPRANTQTRVVAALQGLTGQVTYLQRSKVGVDALCAFYAQLHAVYPQATTVYIVQDCWPTHAHPQVLAALHRCGFTPLFLPTYASWLNPIEKLWRWLRQDVLHLHPCADDLAQLRQWVSEFLDQFAQKSEALLHYVGLLD